MAKATPHSNIIGLRPGFARSTAGVAAILATLAIALAGHLTDYWQLAALPFLIVAVYALASGDEDLPCPVGDQDKPDRVEREA